MGFLFKIVQRILVPLLFMAFIRSLFRDFASRMGPWENQNRNRSNPFERERGQSHSSDTYYQPNGSETPYSVLGLSPSASDDEVRAKYHELIAKYHPDKFASLHDPEFTRLAAEKFQRVQSAYDEIKRQRGF